MNATSALRNTMYSSVAMYTEFALGLVTSILIARHLGPEAYGSYSAAIWLVGLGIALTNSGTATAAIRFIAELRGSGEFRRSGALLRGLRRLQHLYLLVVLAGIGLVMAVAGARIAPAFDPRWLFGFLAIAISMRSSYMFHVGVIKGHEDFRSIAAIALTASPLNLLFVLLVMKLGLPDHALLTAFLASTVVFTAMSWRRTRRYGEGDGSHLDSATGARVRRQVAYSTALVSLSFLTASEVEVSLLNVFGLHHAAGQFKVAHQLALGSATLVPGVFAALMLPMMARAVHEGAGVAGGRFSSSTSYLMLLAAPVAAFGMVLGPQTVALLYGAPYVEAARWFPYLLAATCLLATTAAGSSLLISTDRQNLILLILIACALLKLALGSLLAHRLALPGAVLAFFTASVANAASTTFMACRASRARLQWARMGRVVAAAATAAIAALPLAGTVEPVVGIVSGGAVFALAYAASTLLFGCWEDGDLEVMRALIRRLPAGGMAWSVVVALAHARHAGRRA